MPIVILMQGLPGSGKTTAARRLQAANSRMLRMSLDDIRFMLSTDPWTPELAPVVTAAHDAALLAAVRQGRDVVVDNTNLWPERPAAIKGLLAGTEVTWRVHSLLEVPLETCIARDAARAAAGCPAVGERVIRELWQRHREAAADGWRLTASWLHEAMHA